MRAVQNALGVLKWKSNCFELLEEKPFQKLRQPVAVADIRDLVGMQESADADAELVRCQ